MKEILVVVGSRRIHGNTDKLSNAFIQGAIETGNSVNKIFLGSKKINGCLGCNACKYGKPCIQRDDMIDIYKDLEKADTVVMASPLYYWTISSQLKAFIERLYAISVEDKHPPLGRYELYPHKDCVLLMSAADNLFWTFEQAVSYYNFTIVNYLGWDSKGMVLAGGCGGVNTKGCIEETEFLKKAYELGKTI